MSKSLLQRATLALAMFVAFPATSIWLAPSAHAQSTTSGDIAGTIMDQSGAAVPNAKITIKNLATGAVQNLTSNGAGNYRASLLHPGNYQITVASAGFTTASVHVAVSTGVVVPGDVKLAVGAASQTVEVTEAEPLLHTETADISTSFSMQQVQNLPNPGNDLTFVAQTAPGVVMNTTTASNGSAFGYGNFSTFGLPATSNTFTVNGGYENDPFLNLNNSGATNLLLGNNDIAQVSVVNNAYSAQFGGLAGSQVNEISRSGGNQFHGNAVYWWNGRIMNANDYFLNQQGLPRNFDNVNQFAAAVGGPIIKDRTFFFVDYEGLRVIIPATGNFGAPSPAFQATTLATLAGNGNSAEIPYYQKLFGVYNGAKFFSRASVLASDPNDVLVPYSNTNFTHEWLLTARVDQKISNSDNMFIHFKHDTGVQATYTDPINPIFNADSPQPEWEGQFNETHTFSPNIANQLVIADIYYQAIFTNTQLAAANALVPGTMAFIGGSSIGLLGGEDYVWPQGRNVEGYQVIDDLSITHGNHNFKMGWSIRRDDVSDYSPSVETTPLYEFTEGDFQNGYASAFVQQFPSRLTQPVALYNMGAYFQDEWKVRSNFVLTLALRAEHNSDPTCLTNCFDVLNGSFESQSTAATTPYDQLISSGRHRAFQDFQKVGLEPRIGFSFQPGGSNSKSVVRGGFGMFNDAFPATIADSILNNAPTNVGFVLLGPALGGSNILADPSQPGSAAQIASASNKAFVSGYSTGGSNSSFSASVPGFGPPSFTTPLSKIFYPTYEEWSLGVERQLDRATTLSVQYVGDRGYHEPVENNGVNAYQAAGPAIAGYPTAPRTSNFATVTEVGNGAASNYNGLIVSAVRRSKVLTLQANYNYSHALDEISNGGILGFSAGASLLNPTDPFNLRYNYGNADYDSRHNFTAGYVFDLPHYWGPKAVTGGWEFSGTVFHHTGFPFTVTDGNDLTGNGGGAIFAAQIHGVHSCGGGDVYNFNTGGPVKSACPIGAPNYTDPSAFGQQERNQTFGPAYTDTDFSAQKKFDVPHRESAQFVVGAQFFNLFNHPNFANPTHDISNPLNGLITSTVNTPTSILGSGLGGDASPRLVQLKASFNF